MYVVTRWKCSKRNQAPAWPRNFFCLLLFRFGLYLPSEALPVKWFPYDLIDNYISSGRFYLWNWGSECRKHGLKQWGSSTTNCQPATPAASAAKSLPNHSQSMMSDAMRPFAANPQAPERPKKKGQKQVGKNVELQPLVEVYYDALENFYSPVL